MESPYSIDKKVGFLHFKTPDNSLNAKITSTIYFVHSPTLNHTLPLKDIAYHLQCLISGYSCNAKR